MTESLDFDRRLREIDRALGSEPSPKVAATRSRHWVRRVLVFPVKAVLAVVLPFLILVRGASTVYMDYGWPTWLAVGFGGLAAAILLTMYVLWLTKRLTGRIRFSRRMAKIILTVVIFYCGYALVYLSGVNFKAQEIRPYYTALHPILRLGVGTIVLVDRDLIITDLARTPEDYRRMGLPVRESSMHYRQPTGYVHAVDLRTVGRDEWKNRLVRGYFVAMGFRTIRHVGTADHLHVELEPQGEPSSADMARVEGNP